jgi:hypothetical protein
MSFFSKGWSTGSSSSGSGHHSDEKGCSVHTHDEGDRRVQAQKQKQASKLAMTQLLMDQVDSMNNNIKEYIEALQQFIALKKLHDRGIGIDCGEKLENLTKKIQFLNMMVGQAINLMNISITDAHRKKHWGDIALVTQKIALFKRDVLDVMLSPPMTEDEGERAELAKRIAPIIGTLARILAGEKVGIVPPPKLTADMFTEETVAEGMSSYLAAGHEIKTRLKEVEESPKKFDEDLTRMMADGSTKATVEGMKLLAEGTRDCGADLATLVLQDYDKSALDESYLTSGAHHGDGSAGDSHVDDGSVADGSHGKEDVTMHSCSGS